MKTREMKNLAIFAIPTNLQQSIQGGFCDYRYENWSEIEEVDGQLYLMSYTLDRRTGILSSECIAISDGATFDEER